MIERDDVCRAAERISTFVAVRGDDVSLDPLFTMVGLDDEILVHICEHMLAMGIEIDRTGPVVMGALIAPLAAEKDVVPQFTDSDFEELLKPLT